MKAGIYYENNQPYFSNPTTMEAEAEMLAEWNGTNPEEEYCRLEEAADIQEQNDAYEDHSINVD